ncbi:hypothetical protein CPB83DRAFT_840249 [Crepidotus variabilis]|uniref:Uncharacterized protein n=1 Tax=Crepidotus variabilis TaxID=179855 RepID=A0A9P6E564_9AGAR|nr:hypothetical protein CPB83DRAFT_840249 [Crepidotus variabilis]
MPQPNLNLYTPYLLALCWLKKMSNLFYLQHLLGFVKLTVNGSSKCKVALADHVIPHLHLLPPWGLTQPVSTKLSCLGTEVEWELGSPYLTYPFTFHDESTSFNPGYTLLCIFGHKILIRLQYCSQALVKVVADRAARPFANLEHRGLSHRQLLQKVEILEKQLNRRNLKVGIYLHLGGTYCLKQPKP